MANRLPPAGRELENGELSAWSACAGETLRCSGVRCYSCLVCPHQRSGPYVRKVDRSSAGNKLSSLPTRTRMAAIDRAEFLHRMPRGVFFFVDTNKDGYVTLEEYQQAIQGGSAAALHQS